MNMTIPIITKAMTDSLFEFFSYGFFRNAFFASLLSSVACGIIGSYIVARRMVFISGGITHASFGGIGIGYFLGISPILGALIFSLLSAFGIRLASQRSEIREDSAIGILWSLGMAVGIIFIFLTPGYAPNLMNFLFGSVLTVSKTDLWMMLALTLLTVIFFSAFYHTILFISFDEEYARSHNAPVELFNYILLSLVALAIVLHIRVAGIILVISYLTIPQTTANIYVSDLKQIIFLSIAISFIGSVAGLLVSYYLNLPSGATIIFVFVLLFAIAKITHSISQRAIIKKAVKKV